MAQEYEKRTPVFDWEKGDFAVDLQGCVTTATENEAVAQIVTKAQQTVRGAFLIYADPNDPGYDHKYGSEAHDVLTQPISEDVRLSELRRAISEAILYDPWVLEVSAVTITKETVNGVPGYVATLTIRTVFDTELTIEGVRLHD